MSKVKNKTFVLGDCHGGYKALKQCFERSNFDYKKDTLICLGDVVDGWDETSLCIEELLKIKNLIYVLGNHDVWVDGWFKFDLRPSIWTTQGGEATIDSYKGKYTMLEKHRYFFLKSVSSYVDDDNRLFVHGGFKPGTPIKKQTTEFLTWDRDLWENRHNYKKIDDYKEIFVGHTSIWKFSHFPWWNGNVCFMDTGGGWEGKLSIMDVDTKKFWQSDVVIQLYKSEPERGQ